MNEPVIAVVLSLRLYDCTPEQAVQALSNHKGTWTTPGDGEVEIVDAALLFPRVTE